MSTHTQLNDTGYVILRGHMSPEFCAQLLDVTEKLFAEEGEAAGAEFKVEAGCRRLANLVNKGTLFQRVVADAAVLELVEQVVGPDFKLSSINARSTNPNTDVTQPLHSDMAAIADESGFWVCNSLWMLTDVTEENGPMRLVPGSHNLRQLPHDVLDDLTQPHPDEVHLTGKAGDVVVVNAHAWHGGLPNRTLQPRTVLHSFYCRGDKPQQQYQKQLLSEDVQKSLSPQLRRVLALDDPRNDELSRNPAVRSGFLK